MMPVGSTSEHNLFVKIDTIFFSFCVILWTVPTFANEVRSRFKVSSNFCTSNIIVDTSVFLKFASQKKKTFSFVSLFGNLNKINGIKLLHRIISNEH